ncbi:MAG: VCBS repeat-containing protein [Anaerolineae bacterium]|nr:VCBS repeat-containing protein [Candidatus Bipolaricaulota bacterium]MDW8069615.1 VCBS repeat-containing protein [Anaerolineae bacterium]MDW8151307.1 VCBS repeat-containing protein [Candidatus Bipolaricaulota bacterium]
MRRVLRRAGSLAAGLLLVGFAWAGQGERAPELFYWFVDHPDSPFVLHIGHAMRLLVGDFNEDGNPDLIIPAYRGPFFWERGPDYGPAETNIVMLLGNGQGGFGPPRPLLTTKGSFVAELVADIDGDGHEDLVVVRRHVTEVLKAEVQVMRGNGRGELAPPRTVFEMNDIPREVAVADVNGDGHLDFVIAHITAEAVSVFLADGKGRFAYHGSIQLATDPAHLPNRLALADFNKNGHLDLAIGGEVYEDHDRRTRFVAVYLGDGTGGFPRRSFFMTLEPPESEVPRINLIALDYDRDGNVDLITSRKEEILLLLGRGDGTFKVDEGFWFPIKKGTEIVSIVDFNGDGCWDWVRTEYEPPYIGVVVRVSSCGVFLGMTFWPSWDAGVQPVVADLNNDGYPELVYATRHDLEGKEMTRLWVLLNNMGSGRQR